MFSSRRIERATCRDLSVRFVAANHHPDHDTIAKFRRENLRAVAECSLQVLLLAKELKLLRLGTLERGRDDAEGVGEQASLGDAPAGGGTGGAVGAGDRGIDDRMHPVQPIKGRPCA